MSPNDPAMLQRRRKAHAGEEDAAVADKAPSSTTMATTPSKVVDGSAPSEEQFDPSQMALITQEMVAVNTKVPSSVESAAEVSKESEGNPQVNGGQPSGSQEMQMVAVNPSPQGPPVSLAPKEMDPLFLPEQARQLEEMQQMAPIFYQDRWTSPDGPTWMSMATPPMQMEPVRAFRWKKKDFFSSGGWKKRRWRWWRR